MKLNVRRTAGDPITDEQRAQLRALAQKPDSEIDFSDIPEKFYTASVSHELPLEDHTFTLRVDAEVAAWLEQESLSRAAQINRVLKRAARMGGADVASSELLDKAS